MRPRRKEITVVVTLSIKRGVTISEAKREIRSRINDECSYHSMYGNGDYAETQDVRVRKVTKWPTS